MEKPIFNRLVIEFYTKSGNTITIEEKTKIGSFDIKKEYDRIFNYFNKKVIYSESFDSDTGILSRFTILTSEIEGFKINIYPLKKEEVNEEIPEIPEGPEFREIKEPFYKESKETMNKKMNRIFNKFEKKGK